MSFSAAGHRDMKKKRKGAEEEEDRRLRSEVRGPCCGKRASVRL